ncbi:SAM-dependent methyltransferase [Chlorobaculum sp. MV4-Y]|uniref:SAM-dependent methyltransferase n=1 Tax=Chlorobaculum sp. MV4-Y TaxID=2976335 RepID=UPI0021AF8F6E|nr:SAM-dependent methyltransferase [Chlorobaculum sp. MV4-Y]UWX57175.1 SAM-dependent methyltransferase [Chlorobaculum sp. MV4-Y]
MIQQMVEHGENRVLIVGAGPGDPELLTVRGAAAIREADVILYDCGTVEPVLALASERAAIVRVDRSPYETGEAFARTTLGELKAASCSTGLPEPVVYTIGRYVRVRNVPAGSKAFSGKVGESAK